MDNNSLKKIKKNFNYVYATIQKIYKLHDTHKELISNMIEKNNKTFNETLNNLSQEIRTNSLSIKQLNDKTRDLEENLTVYQDLVEEKYIKESVESLQNDTIKNKA